MERLNDSHKVIQLGSGGAGVSGSSTGGRKVSQVEFKQKQEVWFLEQAKCITSCQAFLLFIFYVWSQNNC